MYEKNPVQVVLGIFPENFSGDARTIAADWAGRFRQITSDTRLGRFACEREAEDVIARALARGLSQSRVRDLAQQSLELIRWLIRHDDEERNDSEQPWPLRKPLAILAGLLEHAAIMQARPKLDA